jgi:hypothetical protein
MLPNSNWKCCNVREEVGYFSLLIYCTVYCMSGKEKKAVLYLIISEYVLSICDFRVCINEAL